MRSRRASHEQLTGRDLFSIGTAVSSHQTEGGNYNDWTEHETSLAPAFQASGDACGSFELFRRDHQALQEIGGNTYRLSLEWSRIEPQQGQFDDDAISHYEAVIDDLLARGITPVITIHHFTNPVWFEKAGGWKNKQSSHWYAEYVRKIVPRLNGRVKYWLTLNEPNVMVQQKYVAGVWHPHEQSIVGPYFTVYPKLLRAHKAAYEIIKTHNPEAMVGFTSNFASLHPDRNLYYPINYYYYFMYSRFSNYFMFDKLRDHMDFVGLNFYTRARFSMDLLAKFRGEPHIRIRPKPPEGPNDLEFDAHPEDISPVIRHLVRRYKKPLMVTENGFVTNNDPRRAEYLRGINRELLDLRQELGHMFLGYLHWTLMDNFEWNMGFEAQFGLFSLDRTRPTMPLKKKPSADVFADMAAEHHALSLAQVR